MSNSVQQVKINEADPKFKELKDSFTEEIKHRFSCDDYDAIVNYVFNFVFVSKNSKENCIKEMKELFYDKTEELINYLWDLTDSIYSPNLNQVSSSIAASNDLLDEIYKEKNDSSLPKKFPSQIVNPNAEASTSAKNYKQSSHKDDRRKDPNVRDYRDRERKYSDSRRDDLKDRDERKRYSRNEGDRMQVGGKQVVLRKKGNIRSRSRSRSRSDEYDKDKRKDERSPEEFQPMHMVEKEYFPDKEYERDDYGKHYYPQDRYRDRGYYQQRRGFNMRGGRFGRFMRPQRYIDTRTRMPPRMNNPLIPRFPPKKEFQNLEVPETISQPMENVATEGQGNAVIEPSAVVERKEETQTPVIKNPEEVNKKKIRCKKWPQCKIDGCEYAHPSETCPHFPKCAFGDKCLYIHPNIPCKYGFYCTRLGCAYSHPTGYNPGMGMYSNMMQMNYGHPKYKNLKVDHSKNPNPPKNPKASPAQQQGVVKPEPEGEQQPEQPQQQDMNVENNN